MWGDGVDGEDCEDGSVRKVMGLDSNDTSKVGNRVQSATLPLYFV